MEAADPLGVEYTPVVNNVPGLFTGGAAFVAFTRQAKNKAGHLKPRALARVLANQPCPRERT